jgi:hypothetical protein
MRSSDSLENDRKERLPGWEKEEASDDLLDVEAKRKLFDYQVPKEEDNLKERRESDGRE